MVGGIAFGPVSSRRLGASLGVNNIPTKTCTYSCVYCQIGRTSHLTCARGRFSKQEEILRQVAEKLEEVRAAGARVDYITFVPDGEPTLDEGLGGEIELLKGFGLPVAVITNSSLLWRADVREDLARADLVSVKVDTVDERLWRRINRPHKGLALRRILGGIEDFADGFGGTLVSETMVLGGVEQEFGCVADFLSRLEGLDVAYMSTATRPPAEVWVSPAAGSALEAAERAFSEKLGRGRVIVLARHEGDLPGRCHINDPEEAVLGIVAVHPLREDVAKRYLAKAGVGWEVIERLIDEGKIRVTEHDGNRYLRRSFKG
jgi:wyosine [tRNA(Phe)-imidazoG37] synthetase (radical SAM superfamily)